MTISGRECPDCGRTLRVDFEETVTGREVCPDCAKALWFGSAVGAVTDNAGPWAMMMRRIMRKR